MENQHSQECQAALTVSGLITITFLFLLKNGYIIYKNRNKKSMLKYTNQANNTVLQPGVVIASVRVPSGVQNEYLLLHYHIIKQEIAY